MKKTKLNMRFIIMSMLVTAIACMYVPYVDKNMATPVRAEVLFDDNTNYIINNGFYGKYLTYSSSNLGSQRGVLSSLGSVVNWKIKKVTNGYVICPRSNVNKYLAAQTITSSNVILYSISGTSIPDRCKWVLTYEEGSTSRCTLRNVATGKYLSIQGSDITCVDSVGAVNTSSYDKCIWRIYTRTFCENKELKTLEPRKVLTLLPNEKRYETFEKIGKNGSTAVMCACNDFTYSWNGATDIGYDYATKKFSKTGSNSSNQSFTVTMTHKITQIQKTFKVVINPKMTMFALRPTDEELATGGYEREAYMLEVKKKLGTKFSGYNMLVSTASNTYTGIDMRTHMGNDNSNIFVARTHGFADFKSESVIGGIVTKEVNDTSIILSNTGMENVSGENIRLSGIDLSNMRLMVYAACKTGEYTRGVGVDSNYGTNLLKSSVEAGADCAVGFIDSIDCSDANKWTIEFFKKLNEGYTIQNAIDSVKKTNTTWNNSISIKTSRFEGNGNIKIVY